MSSRSMTLDKIDQALADWQERLRRVDENLVALEADPTCQLLEHTPLEGVTQARVSPALAATRELFECRSLLHDMLARATTLRGSVSRLWPSERTLAEIEELLRGRSIRFPPVQTPLAQRGLLTAAEREEAISPEDLLAAMLGAFEVARDAVMAVDGAWTRLYPTVEAAQREVESVQRLAASLGEEAGDELAAARAEVEALRQRIARDPLGAEGELDGGLSPRLRGLRDRLRALAEPREQVTSGRERARALLNELQDVHAAGRECFERCRREIERPPGLTEPPEHGVVDGLTSWLETLEAAVGGGRWQAAQVGLARWLEAAERGLAGERAAYAANAAPLAMRDELIGRLSARRAQLRALMVRGVALDPELDVRAAELEELLRRRPTPLSEAATQVGEYEAHLAALLRR
jgi:hypothetical protein